MTSRKKRRMWVLLLCAIGVGSATALTLTAFQDNLVFFRSPSDIAAERPSPDRAFRLGGLVESGSVEREPAAAGGRPRPTAPSASAAWSRPAAWSVSAAPTAAPPPASA